MTSKLRSVDLRGAPAPLRFLILLASAAVLANACVVRLGEGDGFDDDDTTLLDDDGGSSVDAGSGGSAGAGGTTASVGNGGSGGGGGAPSCTAPAGTGQSGSACDALPTSPSNSSATCDGFDSLPYMSCSRAFEIYNAGQAEQLAACLGGMGEADACAEDPVGECVTAMYDDACEAEVVAEVCQMWTDQCADGAEVLDQARCVDELNPFNDAALTELADCMNAEGGSCQERYDVCFETVTTL